MCADPRRDAAILCVVETPRDLAAFERAGTFRGRYHVLGGRLAPLDNMGPEKLTIDALVQRVHEGDVKEVQQFVTEQKMTMARRNSRTRLVWRPALAKARRSCWPATVSRSRSCARRVRAASLIPLGLDS